MLGAGFYGNRGESGSKDEEGCCEDGGSIAGRMTLLDVLLIGLVVSVGGGMYPEDSLDGVKEQRKNKDRNDDVF